MRWENARHGPVINARLRWLQQEHDRRAARLGARRAAEWEEIVSEFATGMTGAVPVYKVLQLMEDTYAQGKIDAANALNPLNQLKELP